MNIFWYDVETTGLNRLNNEIIQLAAVVTDENLTVLGEFVEYCRPDNFDNIQQEALDCNGITLEQLQGFQDKKEFFNKLLSFIDPFKKMQLGGYNIERFDNGFLFELFRLLGADVLKFYDVKKNYDVYRFVKSIYIPTINNKLVTICNHYEIEITNIHDAYSDICATINVYKKLKENGFIY
jgi:DNA polymerase III alpha subunit (gram-positive type)